VGGHDSRDSPSFQLVPELTSLAREAVFDEITIAAFLGTPLGRPAGSRSAEEAARPSTGSSTAQGS
jgi:hypothetical protein